MFLLGFMTPFHLFSATRECPASPAGTGKGRQQTEAPEQLLSLMAKSVHANSNWNHLFLPSRVWAPGRLGVGPVKRPGHNEVTMECGSE